MLFISKFILKKAKNNAYNSLKELSKKHTKILDTNSVKTIIKHKRSLHEKINEGFQIETFISYYFSSVFSTSKKKITKFDIDYRPEDRDSQGWWQ